MEEKAVDERRGKSGSRRRRQREEGQGANEDNVLTYLRNACQVILYHLLDRNNEESKSVIQFTRDLNVGHFADSNVSYALL